MPDAFAIEIRPARPAEKERIYQWMQQGLSEDERKTRLDKAVLDLAFQLVAVRDGKVLGGIYWQIEANNSGLLWLPRCDPGIDSADVEAISLLLLDAVTEQARQAGLDLAQAIVNENAFLQDRQLLEKSGYRHLADLLYLVSTSEMMPERQPESLLEFEPYEETEYERLALLVEATYQGTLDCPGLNGVQSIHTVLEGYRNIGRFFPQHWRFIRHGGQDIGCLLLAEHPSQKLFELVYMGLIPEARGRGWGYEIARFAQWMTRAADYSHLVVAVDAVNRPAIRGYEQAGFFSWDRRRVYVKVL